jgi:hypothetical protein
VITSRTSRENGEALPPALASNPSDASPEPDIKRVPGVRERPGCTVGQQDGAIGQ